VSELLKLDFGSGASEFEENLKDFFYRSVSFALASSEKTFVIVGSKGAGKSAIFRMFGELQNEISIFHLPNLWLAEQPSLREHLHVLASKSLPTSQVVLWRFYIATLVAQRLSQEEDLPDQLRKSLQRFLVRWEVVAPSPTIWQSLRFGQFKFGFEGIFSTELPIKIPLAITEIDQALLSAATWLEQNKRTLWICLDKLDEVSLNGGSVTHLEELLSNLMKAVSELIRFRPIRFKLFFRTDVYNALTYVNKDHFSSAKLELRWSKEDLAIMLGYRLRPVFSGDNSAIKFPLALQWIDAVFGWSEKSVQSFEQLYSKLMDGNGDVLPRDVINFCSAAKRAQQAFDLQGINSPPSGKFISPQAIAQGLKETAQSKMDDFIQVFENYRKHFEQLRGHASRHFKRKELSAALGQTEKLDADLMISDLVRVGAVAIKDKRVVNLSDSFEIPYLYALALELGGIHE
jgi:hypothetical protein